MSKVQVGELEFKIAESGGEGPLVILLHGFGSGPLEWHRILPHLQKKQFRVCVPNLMPLFSASRPLGYSKQVEILGHMINQLNPSRDPFMLVGSSYGGTLSWGLRAHFQSLVQGHAMINPMPLDPLGKLRSAQLRMLFGMNMVPGALPLFLKTRMGRELSSELGKVFGLGHDGRRELGGLTERKLSLIAKAVQRFAWICQHEDWFYWSLPLRENHAPTLLITSEQDPLFDVKDFRSYQNFTALSEHFSISQGGHVLLRSHADEIGGQLSQFIADLVAESETASQALRPAI